MKVSGSPHSPALPERTGLVDRTVHRIADSTVGRFVHGCMDDGAPWGRTRLAMVFGGLAGSVGCFSTALSLYFGTDLSSAACIGVNAGSIALSVEGALLNAVSLDSSARLSEDISRVKAKIDEMMR